MSGKIINLRAVRKRKNRAEAATTADENAVRHGRSKAAKSLDAARAEKERRDFDGHRRTDAED